MQILFNYKPSTGSAPAGFRAALSYVAGVLDALITNPITVNINVGWNEIGGVTLGSGDVSEGGPLGGINMSYANLVAALTANARNPAARQELASLPAIAPSQIGSYYIAPAQEKAWGLLSPTATSADGEIGFSSAYSYSFDPNNQSAPGMFGFIGLAEHEIAHALGRINTDGPLELVDYAAPGVLATPNTGGYFSLDGGKTNLGQFAPVGDTADWAPPSTGDAFGYLTYPGTNGVMTPVDKTLLGVLGFNVNTAAPSAGPVVVPPPPPRSHRTRHGPTHSGAAAGMAPETIQAGGNGSAPVRSAFIHNPDDATDVRAAGGSEKDTCHVIGHEAASARWSSLANAHSGDTAAIGGVTPADFTLDRINTRGAHGAMDLTGNFAVRGHPEAKAALPGYLTADRSNGRLSSNLGTSLNEMGFREDVHRDMKGG